MQQIDLQTTTVQSCPQYWCPGTKAIDAFTCDWGQDTNWVYLPPYQVSRY